MTDFPTARSMLPNDRWLCLFVWCKACHHQAPADLRAIIAGGRGDVPVKDLKFRCAKCGSRMTDSVMMSGDALRVQPWRADDADSTSRAAGHLRGQAAARRPRLAQRSMQMPTA
jgi:hypothetical protein